MDSHDRPVIRFDDGPALLLQAFESFFNPEIMRRRAAGQIDETFGLFAAQVVFHVDGPAEIRFNDEVRVISQLRRIAT